MRLLLAAAGLLLATAAPAWAQPVSFGLIGDIPYSARERVALTAIIEAMNRETLAFVIHDGDIKSGLSPCSDEVYQDVLGLFQQSRHPLVYVPGDNEWTDCHRPGNGGYAPLERLGRLRQLFFAEDRALGARHLPLARQRPGYPENVRWQAGGYLFLGLNVPGSNNNRGRDAEPPIEFRERSAANRAWLAAGFDQARREKLAGVFIVIQANPGFEKPWWSLGGPDGYREFIDQLREETLAFPGPVVLVHGDSHDRKVDQPLRDPRSGQPLANFTRIETYGSPFLGWIKATVDPASPGAPRFEARPWLPQPDDTRYAP